MKVYRSALVLLSVVSLQYSSPDKNFNWDDAYIEFVKSLKEYTNNDKFRKQVYKGLKDGFVEDEKFIVEFMSVPCGGYCRLKMRLILIRHSSFRL